MVSGNVDAWLDFVRTLPAHPAPSALMTLSAVSAAITALYQRRVAEMDAAAVPGHVLRHDTVFELLTDHFASEAGRALHMEELQHVNGPIARLLMSCRCEGRRSGVGLTAVVCASCPHALCPLAHVLTRPCAGRS